MFLCVCCVCVCACVCGTNCKVLKVARVWQHYKVYSCTHCTSISVKRLYNFLLRAMCVYMTCTHIFAALVKRVRVNNDLVSTNNNIWVDAI